MHPRSLRSGIRAHNANLTPRGGTLDPGFLVVLWCETHDLIAQEAQVDPTRKTALIAGVLFLITYITAIPAAFLLYPPVLNDANYIVGAGADTRVALGALLEVILIIANVGTAVVLFPTSSGRTKRSLSAMSQPDSLNAPSSPSGSSASLRS